MTPTAPTAPRAPHLPHHGLGQDLSPARPTQQVGCLQEDLRPVSHRLQVPLPPGGQGGPDGSVEQGLMKRERLGASPCSRKSPRGAIWRSLSTQGGPLPPSPDSGRRAAPGSEPAPLPSGGARGACQVGPHAKDSLYFPSWPPPAPGAQYSQTRCSGPAAHDVRT